MESNSWKALRTIPRNEVEVSLPLMDAVQVELNIIEISLLALNHDKIMHWLHQAMSRDDFYLKYRYILETVLNGALLETTKKLMNAATARFDERYVNGPDEACYTETTIMYMPFHKERRLKFLSDKEKVIHRLNELSQELFKYEEKEAKQTFFQEQIEAINVILQEKQDEQNFQDHFPSVLKGFIFCTNNSLRKLVNINIKNSFFIQTKNRNPLVLDFEFARFLYKNDDQLAHEVIAMELIKYINALLGKPYALAYDIIPEKEGALYEFVENSLTVHQIKQRNENGLVQHIRELGSKGKIQDVLNTFAETYSGFCLIQYLMDVKDRNNANIMVRQDGTIFHIDLAFIFSAGPGGFSFESAPFKMTTQYIKVLGGFDSDYFRKYQALMVQHFTKLLECKEELMWKLQILARRNKQIRCFRDYKFENFAKKLPKKQEKVKEFVQDLIDRSHDSWKTTKYDEFQFKSNGILK